MKTKSCWGEPPARLYRFIHTLKSEFSNDAKVCVIGASDGKFVFPFLRNGFRVVAYEIDEVALFGGMKEFPVKREKEAIVKLNYTSGTEPPVYPKIPITKMHIDGLLKRADAEGLRDQLQIRMENYYKCSVTEKYDVVFTSCSIPYECNLDVSVECIMDSLMRNVEVGGYLYMDYMMPLEDGHSWKPRHYFRTGEMKKFFLSEKWDIVHIYEMHKPIFEAAHVDRAEDHFHRFGYIMAKRIKE